MSEAYIPPPIAEEAARQEDLFVPADIKVENVFLNQWRESIAEVTDASTPLVFFAGIGMLSVLCHEFYFSAPRDTHLNLFLFMLGQSSLSRKTTVIDIVRDYIGTVAPDLILPDQFTGEALFTCLAERPRGIVIVRELHSWLMAMLTKDYNRGLSSDLGNIYDHTKIITKQTQKGGFKIINDPVITILGGGVDEWLIDILKKIDMVSGFWPRVTLVQLPHSDGKDYRPPGKFLIDPDILEKLTLVVAQTGGELDCTKINPLREAYAANLGREAAELESYNLAACYSRLEWTLVKIAAILHLADNPNSRVIEPASFNDAVNLVEHIKQGLPYFYSEHIVPGEEAKLAVRIFNFIKKRDQESAKYVPYRTILHYSSGNTVMTQAALTRLVETGQCDQVDVPPSPHYKKISKAYRTLPNPDKN